jgi:FkbM family methyltransferase
MSLSNLAHTQLRRMTSPLRARLRPFRQIVQRLKREGAGASSLALGRSTFSQFGEDLFLDTVFAETPAGFYVDVGAYHPFRWSNTCLLYQRGWRGINVEPDPEGIALFNRHRPRDINLPVAVAGTEGQASFARLGVYGGIESGDYMWSEREGERITVATQPLSTLLDQHLPPGQQIDLLDVDCEGMDLSVLRSGDWQRFRPRLVLAEAHDAEEEASLAAFMESVGYRRMTRFHLTLMFEDAATTPPQS